MRLFPPTLLAVAIAVAAGALAKTRPNILFVMTDDQGPWAMTNAGNPDADTPAMDRLAAEGAKLVNFFTTTPVCSPSRVGFLASRYGSEVGITDWIMRAAPGTRDESQLADPSLPTSRNGRFGTLAYRTGLVGKWHLGTQDRYLPAHFGYDFFYGFREGGAKVVNPELEHNGVIREEEGLTTDLLTDKALDFLKESAGSGQPFVLSLHYRAPHAPWKPVAEADEALGRIVRRCRRIRDCRTLSRALDSTGKVPGERGGGGPNLRRVLALLDETGLALILPAFTSDHGYNVGHHGLIHKVEWIVDDAGGTHRRRRRICSTSMQLPTIVRWSCGDAGRW